jgi:hypothetical protein
MRAFAFRSESSASRFGPLGRVLRGSECSHGVGQQADTLGGHGHKHDPVKYGKLLRRVSSMALAENWRAEKESQTDPVEVIAIEVAAEAADEISPLGNPMLLLKLLKVRPYERCGVRRANALDAPCDQPTNAHRRACAEERVRVGRP